MGGRSVAPEFPGVAPEKLRLARITADPDPYEPFRLALGYRVGNLLSISGQAAISPEGEIVGDGDFDAQAEQVSRNLGRVLGAGGSSLANVVKVTIFLTDMGNFPKIVELRSGGSRPGTRLTRPSRSPHSPCRSS